jgi:hypothetical protein
VKSLEAKTINIMKGEIVSMRRAFLVILALVMALTMVICSAGAVSAAPTPKATITIYDFNAGEVSANVSWNHLGVYQYWFNVYKKVRNGELDDPTAWDCTAGPFQYGVPNPPPLRTLAITSHTLPNSTIEVGYYYKIAMEVYGRDQRLIKTFWSEPLYYYSYYNS